MTSSAQLAAILSGLSIASERVRSLKVHLANDEWLQPPGVGRWSAVECIEHLNITSRAYVKLLTEGLSRAQPMASNSKGGYRLDLFGWLLVKSLGSKGNMSKSATAPDFVPKVAKDVDATLAEFDSLQAELSGLVSAANGLSIDKVKILSPFNGKVRYNIYSAMRILVTHEFRHIDQAEAAAKGA